jgi:hypothetical protein
MIAYVEFCSCDHKAQSRVANLTQLMIRESFSDKISFLLINMILKLYLVSLS